MILYWNHFRKSPAAKRFQERHMSEEALREEREKRTEQTELMFSNSFMKQRSALDIQKVIDDGLKFRTEV